MKKTLNTLARRAAATLLSLSLLCTVCFTSCSDDDDDDGYSGTSGNGTLSTVSSLSAALSDDTPNVVTLSWYDSSYYVVYYWVYINTEDDSSTAELLASDVTGSSYTITYDIELETSGTYYFWVKRAKGTTEDSTTSAFSSTASIDFTYREDPNLSAPTNLTATAEEDDVSLSWSGVDGASYYWVYYNTTNDTESATLLASDVTETSYTATVSYDGNYYFWVKAADGSAGNSFTSDFSDVYGIYVAFKYELDAPEDVAVTLSSSTLNVIEISWTKVSSVTYYSIYYNTDDDPSTSTLLEKNVSVYSSGTHTKKETFSESGTYYFWIKSQSGYWSSSASAVHTSDFSDPASIEFTYTTLEAPDDLAVTRPYTNALKISWEDTGAAYYWVYYNTEDDSTTAAQLDKTTSASTILALDEDDDGTTYYFWVKAADGTASDSMVSALSDSVSYSFTYKELSAPTIGTIAKAYSTTYKLSWSTDAYISRVYQGTEDDSSSAEFLKSTTLNYTYITLDEDGTYYFWVKSADSSSSSSNTSDFSESVSITISSD